MRGLCELLLTVRVSVVWNSDILSGDVGVILRLWYNDHLLLRTYRSHLATCSIACWGHDERNAAAAALAEAEEEL